MADNKMNVLFKKGLLANLKNAPIVDGTIYMTTDEGGIYLGHNGSLKRMGDFITGTYSEISKITNASQTALYYATDYNILMRYDGAGWVQINSQKSLKQLVGSLDFTVTGSENNANVKIIMKDGEDTLVAEDAFDIKGANAAKASVAGDVITVDATKYDLATVNNTAAATLRLGGTGGAAAENDDITIEGAGLAHVSSDANKKITVNVKAFSASETASVSGNKATVTQSIVDGDSNAITTSSHTITGDGDITVTASGNNVTISGKNTVGALSAAGNKVVLKNAVNGGTAAEAGSVEIKADGNLNPSVATANNAITISVNGPEVAAAFDANGALGINLKNGDDVVIGSTSVTPTVKYGKAEQEAKFVNGAADLDVYTITEIDNLLKGLNAMTFKGGLGANAIAALTAVQNGDAYKVTAAGNIGTQSVKVGDLVIYAGGDDTADATKWTVIPSADEEIITYALSAANGQFTLVDNGENATGVVKQGTMITITGSGNEATIAHANKTVTTSAIAAQSFSAFGEANQSVTVMGEVTADGQGHVAKAQKGAINFTPIKTSTLTAEVANNVVEFKASLADADDNVIPEVVGVKVSSESLTIAATTDGASVELTWGEF